MGGKVSMSAQDRGRARSGTPGLGCLTIGLLGGMIAGLVGGLDRDPLGRWAMTAVAAMGMASALLLLWESGPPWESRSARWARIFLLLLPIGLLLLCRAIALTAP
jgi:hypothetical protein